MGSLVVEASVPCPFSMWLRRMRLKFSSDGSSYFDAVVEGEVGVMKTETGTDDGGEVLFAGGGHE